MATIEEKYKEIGVDTSKFTKYGEMNVLIQMFGNKDGCNDDGEKKVNPICFMPRKGYCYDEEFDLANEDAKSELIAVLNNSIERLKVWQYLLTKQRDEIIKFGYPKTTCYYPELNERDLDDFNENGSCRG